MSAPSKVHKWPINLEGRTTQAIMYENLEIRLEGAQITQIAHGAMINFTAAQRYLIYLEDHGLVENKDELPFCSNT